MANKRGHLRVDCLIDITFYQDGHASIKAANVSESGIMFLSEKKFPMMDEFELAFTLPGMQGAILCKAVVVWEDKIDSRGEHGDYVAGLYFTEINQEEREKIKEFIKKKKIQIARKRIYDFARKTAKLLKRRK